jgi:hypothetical protein
MSILAGCDENPFKKPVRIRFTLPATPPVDLKLNKRMAPLDEMAA